LGLVALCFSPCAQAGYIVNIVQSGSDVVATGSGALNTTSLTLATHFAKNNAYVWAGYSGSLLLVGPTTQDWIDVLSGISGPSSFGSGAQFLADAGAGDKVGINANQLLFVPQYYASGAQVSSTSTWDNTTIAALGLTPGAYTWTWGGGLSADTFVVNIQGSTTPEPASACLLGVGAFGLALMGRFRKLRRRPRILRGVLRQLLQMGLVV
jgi:hypothetical protein